MKSDVSAVGCMPLLDAAVWNRDLFLVTGTGQLPGKDFPRWITQEYYDRCAQDADLQSAWTPQVGDWFVCKDLYKILQIESLEEYYSVGEAQSKYDRGKDSTGRWECDIHLPTPYDETT